jgi:hypothetical protein
MFQTESDLVMGQGFITAPEKLFGLLVEFELRTSYFVHGVCPLRGIWDERGKSGLGKTARHPLNSSKIMAEMGMWECGGGGYAAAK